MIDASWYQRLPGIPEHISAGGIIARSENGVVLVALIRELDHPNFVLPKGHLEEGESPEGAARREIEEESGITDLKFIRELGVRERMDFSKRSWKKTHFFLFLTQQIEGTPSDSHHHHHSPEWFPIDELPAMFWPEQKELIENNRNKIVAELKQGFGN